MQEEVPVPWFRLHVVHAVKVEIGHCVVLCITSHIDNLRKEKRERDVFWCQVIKVLVVNWLHFVDVTVTLQFCSQKDLGMNWTGRWVLMRRGVVVRWSAASLPVLKIHTCYLILFHLILALSCLLGFFNRKVESDLSFSQTIFKIGSVASTTPSARGNKVITLSLNPYTEGERELCPSAQIKPAS